MKQLRRIALLAICLLLGMSLWAAPSFAEESHSIQMTIKVAPDTQLSESGTVEYLTFTIANRGSESYTLNNARLSGGYDGIERQLEGDMTVSPGGSKEFTLYNVPVSYDQLGNAVRYTLTWEEIRIEEPEDPEDPEAEPVTVTTTQSTSAMVLIERFIPPVLTVSVSASDADVSVGESFTVTYRIANETKYDITDIEMTDPGVYEGTIPLPGRDLTAGASITVPVTYTMEEEDMEFRPVLSYVAARRPTVTEAEESVVVGTVVVGIQLDVQQYPANEEGTTFAITVTNTGNRAMKQLQLYDEINTPIESAFDLGPQQQKVISFTVPSAYSAGIVRTVTFRLTGKDFFGDDFQFTDVNSYTCAPYITSDAVRLSLFASITNAFIDDSGKLCGTVRVEIRNYSDVRIVSAVLEEMDLFGDVQTYDELQRGETFFTTTYQLDNVPELMFRLRATDVVGQSYTTEPVTLSLDQLRALATKTETPTVIYYSNAFLKQLTDRIGSAFRNVVFVVLLLVGVSVLISMVLWFLEHRITAQLPRDSILSIKVPTAAKPAQGAIDHVLKESPAEQLGYIAPAKIRYGSATLRQQEHEESIGKILFAPLRGRQEPAAAAPKKPAAGLFRETAPFHRPDTEKPKQAEQPQKAKPVEQQQKPKPAAEPQKQSQPGAQRAKANKPKARMQITDYRPTEHRRRLHPNERIRIGSGRNV